MVRERLIFDFYEVERQVLTIEVSPDTIGSKELIIEQVHHDGKAYQNTCRIPLTRARLESIIGFLSSKLDTIKG